MNNLSSFPFETDVEREQLVLSNSDKRVSETHFNEDSISGVITFDDMEQEKYIQSLEDQLLLLTDEMSGGIL